MSLPAARSSRFHRCNDLLPFTHLGRAFERATGSAPFKIPDTWWRVKEQLDLQTPFCISTTSYIVGGNSGSPLIDAEGRIAHCFPHGLWIYYRKLREAAIGKSQQRAIQNYRSRLGERGLARFEVLGRDTDRDLIRTIARTLAEDSAEAMELRAAVTKSMAGEPPRKGGILAALRRSPLVGADIDVTRAREQGREVDI